MLYPHPNLPQWEGLVASLRFLRWYLIGSLFCREEVTLRSERRFRFASLRTPTPSTCTSAHLPKVRRFPAFPSHLPKVGFSIITSQPPQARFSYRLAFSTFRSCGDFPRFHPTFRRWDFLARTRKNRRHGVCWEELGSQCVKVEGCGSWRFLK